MPQCQAFGCSNIRGSHNEKGKRIAFFPIPDPAKSDESYELCRRWIRAIGTDKFDYKKYKFHRDRVVCEEHFTSDCFEDDMKARLMGTEPQKKLKPGSVPTIFSFRPEIQTGSSERPGRTELRIQAKERQEVLESLVPTKKPKKGWKTKTSSLDLSQILEAEIPVAASQEVTTEEVKNTEENRSIRRVVRKYTCFIRDIGVQADVPRTNESSQTDLDADVIVPVHGHDYLSMTEECKSSEKELNVPSIHVEDIPEPLPFSSENLQQIDDSTPESPPEVQRHVLDLPSLFGSKHDANTFLKKPSPVGARRMLSPKLSSTTTSPSISGKSESSKPYTSSSSPSLPASPLYSPSEEEPDPDLSSDTSEEGSREDKLIRQKKFIIFEQSLDDLIGKVRCSQCLTPAIETLKTVKGTMVSVQLTCHNGHKITSWQSQPLLKETPCGNVLLAAAILFSGCSFSQIEQCFKFMGVQCFGKSMFYETLRTTLIPVVNHTYLKHQKEVFQRLDGCNVWLSGDGRCDSPGYNAKYCSYTLMDTKTQQIVNTELVQVTDTTSSVAMEKMGFEKCIDKIEANNIKVTLVATDRHAGIRKLIRTKYPHLSHNFDVWHFVKSLRKKLLAKAKKKDFDNLTPWIQAICNHLWWCCQHCGQDAKMLREMWTSILKHIVNVHSWVDGEKFHQCSHPPLSDEESRLKCWLQAGSPTHLALQDVVLNKTLLKDMEHLVNSCHTGALEVFHNSLLKYCPKRQEFAYPHMQARMHLAVLDHNMNVNRKQAVVKRATKSSGAVGTPRFTMAYSKAQRKWVAKKSV